MNFSVHIGPPKVPFFANYLISGIQLHLHNLKLNPVSAHEYEFESFWLGKSMTINMNSEYSGIVSAVTASLPDDSHAQG